MDSTQNPMHNVVNQGRKKPQFSGWFMIGLTWWVKQGHKPPMTGNCLYHLFMVKLGMVDDWLDLV